MKGGSVDEFGGGDDISDDEEKSSKEGAWPGREGRRRVEMMM